LGEPGSGKTTTLLELAANLITRAKADAKERVPFVLNLSSWRKKQSLAEWIAVELSEKYRVPVKIARSWLQNDYLVPLLDGLDAVPTAVQPDCVAAINDFIDGSNPSGLVVCCRLLEYQWLPKRLKLNGAICLESLSSEEVSNYLLRGGFKLAALREAVDTDPVLQELAQTPLMLSIMSLACQGVGGNELARHERDSPEERRKEIFRLYVERMFQRKGTASLVFPKEKSIGWLSWLAGKMREHSQSVFLVEGLQPNCLGTKGKRVIYGTVVALSLGLIALSEGLRNRLDEGLTFGMTVLVGVGLGCWTGSPLTNGVISGLIAALMCGLTYGLEYGLMYGAILGPFAGLIGGLGVGSLNRITLVEAVSWKWNQYWRRTISGLIVGLIAGLVIGQSHGFFGGLSSAIRFGLIIGLSVWLVIGFVGGFTDTVKLGKAFPNQGIKLSLKNALVASFVTGLSVGLIIWLIDRMTTQVIGDPIFYGLLVGSIVGLNRGGSAVIKHYAL
jgi:eukaryotic-like serine/threonine-protein kinase